MSELSIERSERPWGHYLVIHESADTFKVKTLSVTPGQRLSLQSHTKRSEHWFVVEGEGTVWLDDERIDVTPGQSVDIPQGAKHRVASTGQVPLVFVEVQHGSYFGEDDITRYDDDYGRAGSAT